MNSPASARAQSRRRQATVAARSAPESRREQLRQQLPGTVDALNRRRADLVPEDLIAEYVALDWLEWNGGSLRLTMTGTNICRQMRTAEPA